MGLREELIEAFKRVHANPAFCNPLDPQADMWGRHADECIRQMIWTHLSAKWSNPEAPYALEVEEREDGPLKLTAAPEGWKP